MVGHHGLHGERSENGERFVELCASNNMVITTTLFPHKDIYKHTWVSPDTRTKNQIDHAAVCGKFKRSVLDTRSFCGADVSSDHHLVIAKIKLRLCKVEKKANRLKKYNTTKLKVPQVAQKFKIELQNRFSCLADDEANNSDDQAQVQDLENDWKKIKETYQKTAKKVLGFRSRSNKPWISAESWKEIDNRRDDLALISSSGWHIQAEVSNLGRYAKMTGLRINTAKTTMMSWNNPAGRKAMEKS